MYTITATYIRDNYAWSETDVTSETLKTLLGYQDVRISLTWDSDIEEDFFFSVNRTLILNSDQTLTLTDWVATLGQGALTVTEKARGLVDVNCVTTYNLFEMVTAIEPNNILYGEGVEIPEGFDVDLRFQGDETLGSQYSTENIASNCLASVNGLIYPIEVSGDWAYIRNAVAQLRLNDYTSVMMIDFTAVGGLTVIPITTENSTSLVKSTAADRPLTNVRIDLGMGATEQVPLVVADGYLNVLNGTYKLVEGDQLIFTVDHFTALKRASEKAKYTRNWVDPANLQGNGLIVSSFDATKFMTDTCSFVVLINNKDIAVKREKLQNAQLPRSYYHHRIPKGPTFFNGGQLANGRVIDYNEFSAAITTIANEEDTHSWEITPITNSATYIDHGYKEDKQRYKDAYVVEIYSFA